MKSAEILENMFIDRKTNKIKYFLNLALFYDIEL